MNVNDKQAAEQHSTTGRLLHTSLLGPAADFVGGGGKRVRGALTQIAYEMAGATGQISPAISEAIEFLHAGSLVIDDIQDDSQDRRGQPTMHSQIGTPLAINAGNWMYFRALEILASAPSECQIRSAMTLAMIQTGRRCHEGQALDLVSRINDLSPSDWLEVATSISEQKTGELVRLAMTLGGLAGGLESGASPAPEKSTLGKRSLVSAMDRFGIHVGVALQMRNDLDELSSLAMVDHEGRDDDLRNARVTWPWVWLASVNPSRARELSQRPIQTHQQSVSVAMSILPEVACIGDAAIGELLDRETRLLGEHVLELETCDLLEQILQPIRFGKFPRPHHQEYSDACNR